MEEAKRLKTQISAPKDGPASTAQPSASQIVDGMLNELETLATNAGWLTGYGSSASPDDDELLLQAADNFKQRIRTHNRSDVERLFFQTQEALERELCGRYGISYHELIGPGGVRLIRKKFSPTDQRRIGLMELVAGVMRMNVTLA